VREDAKSWKVEKNDLVLRTMPGYLHAGSNNSRNILLRTPPDAARLAVEVFMESSPKVQFEHAGVVWYYDDDHYVSLFHEVLGGKPQMQMVIEKAGKPGFRVLNFSAPGLWLRLVIKDGKALSQCRKTPEEKWRTVGEAPLPTPKNTDLRPRVGIMAGGAPKDAMRKVRFRDFRVVTVE